MKVRGEGSDFLSPVGFLKERALQSAGPSAIQKIGKVPVRYPKGIIETAAD